MDDTYTPSPLDTKDVVLSKELMDLTEAMAHNVHEVWSENRIKEGWSFGKSRDDKLKTHPCLVPYDKLPDSEQEYDRQTAIGTLKLITKLGYCIVRKSFCRDDDEYNPITKIKDWKWIFPVLIALLFIGGGIILGFTFHEISIQKNHVWFFTGQWLPIIVYAVLCAATLVCISIIILNLLKGYLNHCNKEREILSELYKEEEKGKITKRLEEKSENYYKDKITELEKQVNNLAVENVVKELESKKQKIEILNEKIEYLTKINEKLLKK